MALTKLRLQIDQDKAAHRHLRSLATNAHTVPVPSTSEVTSPRTDRGGGVLRLPSIAGKPSPPEKTRVASSSRYPNANTSKSPGRPLVGLPPRQAWAEGLEARRGSDSGESADTDDLIGVHASQVRA